ncbi:SDR family oxidoreductase [Pseudonocardia sp. RS11V-5]|uniref:SDR family NAD(P)-dependent oxidoreductase n=1 Tax=Pseudonocardia terrae TaxID=2905831 RepID=UPI001E5BD20A|nr:SDR family NAD(P)-dependent oxidoreductase [Pseudonocardia terrae]MCE3554643.1 SDR family oxidoreductase [Pseudonocardia terrae]
MRLAGEVAVIAGAGQAPGETIGNGRAMAVLFAREGADLVLIDVDEASVAETARLVEAEGGKARVVLGDVTTEEVCAEAVRVADEEAGGLDVLVCNVGTNRGDGGVTSVDLAVWERIMALNTRSMLLMCRAALPVMRRRGGGAIVTISSAATRVSLNQIAYKMSKAAVEQATTAVADANARHGIRANTILPGLIETPMGVDQQAPEVGMSRADWAALRDAKVPLGRRMGTAWDVAHAALYLGSDESRFVTGVTLPVDGGQSLRVG